MLDADFGLQVAGEAFGNLFGNPVLSKRGLDKNIQGQQQEKQAQKDPFQYFQESLQVRGDLYVKVCNRIL